MPDGRGSVITSAKEANIAVQTNADKRGSSSDEKNIDKHISANTSLHLTPCVKRDEFISLKCYQ